MADYVDWRIKGPEIAACNCDWGCPCQFNAMPTHGNCRAAVAMRIDEGHFGDVKLDGVRWAGTYAWPGAIHEGNGEAMPIIDERTTAKQREALLKILSGKETEPGATHFSVFAAMLTKIHDLVVKPIEFECDIKSGTGRFRVPGVVEAVAEPIKNPMTKEPHRVRVSIPKGFEFTEAEFASTKVKAGKPIVLNWPAGHGHLCMIHTGTHGIVR